MRPGAINTNFITATLSGAVAAQMTAVVAPASRDSATWLPFAGTISATLGNTDGDYTVYFGFRTILGTVLWTTNFITLRMASSTGSWAGYEAAALRSISVMAQRACSAMSGSES